MEVHALASLARSMYFTLNRLGGTKMELSDGLSAIALLVSCWALFIGKINRSVDRQSSGASLLAETVLFHTENARILGECGQLARRLKLAIEPIDREDLATDFAELEEEMIQRRATFQEVKENLETLQGSNVTTLHDELIKMRGEAMADLENSRRTLQRLERYFEDIRKLKAAKADSSN